MRLRAWAKIVLLAALGLGRLEAQGGASDAPVTIEYYRLRAPGDSYDIEQASGLHYGRLGDREGLWLACDRNGGRSAGRVFFISAAQLKQARHQQPLVADEAFTVAPPAGPWSAFAEVHRSAGPDLLEELHRRIEAGTGGGDGPFLDLEAVTIGQSPAPPHERRLFVVAEEPHSTVLELALAENREAGQARLTAVYAYPEAPTEHGYDYNDGLEGLAYAGEPGVFYWAEEGTKSHTDEKQPRLMFRDPRIGRARLTAGRMLVEEDISQALTRAVWSLRKGPMQTLNALAVSAEGQVLAVDRNGGWILRLDPGARTAAAWLNLYDLAGTNLRDVLAEFPGKRTMPYVSIEGIAVDPAGAIWLVDDPAMPESFRASCLVRLSRR